MTTNFPGDLDTFTGDITWRAYNPAAAGIVSGAILPRYRLGRN